MGQPSPPGTYLLLVHLERAARLQVGRLGEFDFPAGWYLYAGSALGPGGLRARIGRHRRRDKRLHWHIDYLLAVGALKAIWYIESPERLECVWASALARLSDAHIPVSGFGSSDCRCPGHLIYLPDRPSEEQIQRTLSPTLLPEHILALHRMFGEAVDCGPPRAEGYSQRAACRGRLEEDTR